MSYAPPPNLGVRPEPVPMIVVRKAPEPGSAARWGVCSICAHFGRATRFLLPDESAAYERHFHACSERHMAELYASETMEGKNPVLFGRGSGDVELREFIGRHRAAILEGRKKL